MEADRCRDLQPSYAAYAAGLADTLLSERIRMHLGEGCPGCASEIEALMEAFHAVPLGLAVRPFPAAHAADLVTRAKATRQEEQETPILFPETDQLRLWKVLTALAAVAVVATVFWGRAQKESAGAAADDVMQATVRLGDAQRLRQERDILAATLDSAADPAATVLELIGDTPARAFVDVEGATLVLSMDPPRSLEADRLLTVWFAGEPAVYLASLPPGYAAQGGQIRVPLSQGVGEGAKLLITAEPVGAPPTTPGPDVLFRTP